MGLHAVADWQWLAARTKPAKSMIGFANPQLFQNEPTLDQAE
jgi:hypothetical protein